MAIPVDPIAAAFVQAMEDRDASSGSETVAATGAEIEARVEMEPMIADAVG